MALGDAYCSAAELKTHMSVSDAVDDTAIGRVILSVSRWIERHCGRQFNDAGAATARTYRPCSVSLVDVDEFHTTSGLLVKTDSGDDDTFETTITSTDYVLHPLNGVVDGQTGWPYRQIRLRNGASFPTVSVGPSVQVTAQWGWAAVPSDVKEAALIQSARIFGRRYSHNGLIGTVGQGDFVFGVSRQLDPDVRELLAPFVRHALVA